MDEIIERSRREAYDRRSDRELLLSIDRRLDFLERRERQRRTRNIIILVVVVIALAILAYILVPKIIATVNRVHELEAQIDEVVNAINSLGVDRLSGAVDAISEIDFSGLTDAINGIQELLEPITNFFRR